MLQLEKETLGIFLSSHPLADVRDILRERVDCSLADLASRPDGAWVTVGGLITQAKRIRTKSGEKMAFATLDDLEGQVEMLVFNSAYSATRSRSSGPARDRTRAGRSQGARRDEAGSAGDRAVRAHAGGDRGRRGAARGIRPRLRCGPCAQAATFVVRVDARRCDESLIGDLKSVLEHFPGETDVQLEMTTSAGPRRLRFGPGYRVTATQGLRSEMDDLLGPGALVA